jgi:hypothetical protein
VNTMGTDYRVISQTSWFPPPVPPPSGGGR